MTNPWTQAASSLYFPILIGILRRADGEVRVWEDRGWNIDDETFDYMPWAGISHGSASLMFAAATGHDKEYLETLEDDPRDADEVGEFDVLWIKNAATGELLYDAWWLREPLAKASSA